MNRAFFADTLATRPLLWEAMIRANSRKGSASLSARKADECSALFGSRASTLLTWLTERPDRVPANGSESDPGFWDYAEESRRLALLDTESLGALCRLSGVALHAREIAHILRRDELLALRAGIGEDMYRYALYRGQYQLGGVRRLFAGLHPMMPLAERCALHGNMTLRLVASLWPEELSSRFLPSLSPLSGEELPAFGGAELRELWIALKKLLLREVAPSWAPCFD